jgi:ABC-2 type transport system permease protein
VTAQPEALELEDVRGPSALGGGRRRFFDLVWLMSVNEFKKTYYGTVLGYVWSLVRPLALFGVLLFVFTQIFRFGNQVNHYAVLLLFNIVLFTFFAEATQAAVTSVLSEEGIVRKTQFPRLVIPLSVVLTAGLNLLLNLIAVFIFIVAFGVGPYWTWLLLPVLLLPLGVFTSAVAMILSSLYVRYRDVAIIWAVAATALFYGTPVLYVLADPDVVPSRFKPILFLNPLAVIFTQARRWIIDPTAPGAVDAAGSLSYVLVAGAIFCIVCVGSLWIFNREAPRIAEAL